MSGILTAIAPSPETNEYFERIRAEKFQAHDPQRALDLALSGDLDQMLFGIGLLGSWLDDQEMIGVFRARKQKKSWAWIGARLGRSRQAVWERWRDRTDLDPED